MGVVSIIPTGRKEGNGRPFRWALLGLLLGVLGCAETSFVGRQYENVTAYYNTFYNAKTAFEKGVTAVRETERSVDRTRYISIFLEPQEGTNDAPFETAIEKSANLLREHPRSKWVDDALLLIGKSYYYQGNFIGAAQKFREVIALEQERTREARFWLTRTLVSNEQYSEATEVLQALSEDDPSGSWTARLHLVRGELLARQEEWEAAVRALRHGLSGDVPEEPAARGAFLLGQVLETLDHPKEAEIAYRRVQEYDPSYALGLAARLSEIELQGIHGHPSRALERLEGLARDDKNYERRGEIALVRARIYRAQGQYDRARSVLRTMLYGDEPPSDASQGRLHYDLATLYRSAYRDYRQAAAHYDTASSRLPEPQASNRELGRPLPGAPVDANEQADRYRNLADRSREVARLDSLLRIGRMSDEEFERFVLELRRKRQEARDRRRERAASSGRRLRERGEVGPEQRRETTSAMNTRSSDAGFLFHQDPTRVQEGKRRFRETWGQRPRVDNWRRRTAITASRSGERETGPTREPGNGPSESVGGETTDATSSELSLSDVPRDSSSRVEMESNRAVARYELANSLFLAAGRPDSAATLYQQILEENGDHPVAKRARYALAEAYRATGDTSAAAKAYRHLVREHPNTDLAVRARERLGHQPSLPTTELAARADSAYTRAYKQWQQGEWHPALDRMLTLARRYPSTGAAPRALLAAAAIYWQWSKKDSSAVPQSLVRRHLSSIRRDSASGSAVAERSEGLSASTPSEWMSTVDSVARERVSESGGDSIVPTAIQTSMDGGSDTTRTSGRRSRRDSVHQGAAADPAVRDSASGPDGGSPGNDVTSVLTELLQYVETEYPDSRYADRATSMREVVATRNESPGRERSDYRGGDVTKDARARRDSLDRVDRRRTRQDQGAGRPPSSAQVPADDTTKTGEVEADSTERDTAPDARDPLPPPRPRRAPERSRSDRSEAVDDTEWTLLIDTFSSSEVGEKRAERLSQAIGEEWRVTLHHVRDGTSEPYHLLVGRYGTREAARKAKPRVSAHISTPIRVREWPKREVRD